MIHSRKLFDDGKGVVIYIAWVDDTRYDTAPTEIEARQRLEARIVGMDWRDLALSILTNRMKSLPLNELHEWLEKQVEVFKRVN